jgi:hypothetical protein
LYNWGLFFIVCLPFCRSKLGRIPWFHSFEKRPQQRFVSQSGLLALGVTLHFGRLGRATDQGMTERSHQLWEGQVVQGAAFANWQALYDALYQRRDFLNTILPCASLANQPPLTAFPQARHSGRPYRLEWEAELLDLSRIDAYLARGRWFRRVADNGIISLGGIV